MILFVQRANGCTYPILARFPSNQKAQKIAVVMLTIQRGHLMLPGQKSRHQGKEEEESKLGNEIGKSCSAQFSFFVFLSIQFALDFPDYNI